MKYIYIFIKINELLIKVCPKKIIKIIYYVKMINHDLNFIFFNLNRKRKIGKN